MLYVLCSPCPVSACTTTSLLPPPCTYRRRRRRRAATRARTPPPPLPVLHMLPVHSHTCLNCVQHLVLNTLCSTPSPLSPPEQITASTTHERTTVACLARVYGGVAVAAGQATHCVSLSSCGLRRWQGSPLQVEIAVDNLKLYTYTLVDHRGWTSRYRTCILLALPMAVDAAARRRCLLR